MRDFTVQRSDIRRAFASARVFAVSRKIAGVSDGVAHDMVCNLSEMGVKTVFFDSADEVEPRGAVFLAFGETDISAADTAAFLAAPASAPLEVKMCCAYVSSFDGESAVLEMADLIIEAKKS